MKRIRSSVEQIVVVRKQAKFCLPAADVIHKVGITRQSFYRWKKQYKGLKCEQVREIKQLKEENGRFRCVVEDLTLDTDMLKDMLAKKRSDTFAETTHGYQFVSPLSSE